MPRNITTAFRIGKLINLYLKQELTEGEQSELEQWINENTANEQLFQELTNEDKQAKELAKLEQYDDDIAQRQLLDKIFLAGKKGKRPMRLWPYVAAASIALLLIATVAVILMNKDQHTLPANGTLVKQDVPPGSNKAVLTLGNGHTVLLDSSITGILAQQGNTQVIKLPGGQLTYKTEKGRQTETVAFNTLTTPRGGQYQVTLPDGSKVWLNAASSLQYPTRFTGKARLVALTGEAYFEVAKNTAMPFRVITKGMEVLVLGTHFNVNAYGDEAAIKVTLLEGKVRARSTRASQRTDKQSVIITAGQEARLGKDGGMSIIKDAHTDEAVAWKNGNFRFNSTDLEEIMRQLSRWYDVEVRYSGTFTGEYFTGSISRNENVSQVLKMMELTNTIQFTVENRIITVLPVK